MLLWANSNCYQFVKAALIKTGNEWLLLAFGKNDIHNNDMQHYGLYSDTKHK
jgi:hypothetical protein